MVTSNGTQGRYSKKPGPPIQRVEVVDGVVQDVFDPTPESLQELYTAEMWERLKARILERRSDGERRQLAEANYVRLLAELFSPAEPRLAELLRQPLKRPPRRSKRRDKDRDFLLERLQQARLDAGVTQAVAATAIGRPQSVISKIEAGVRRLDIWELHVLLMLYNRPRAFVVRWKQEEAGAATSEDLDLSP